MGHMKAKNWWDGTVLNESDPWSMVAHDFEYAKNLLNELHKLEKFNIGGVVIGGWPEMANPKEKMEYAYNLVLNLMGEMEEAISRKQTNVDFLWLWGEFQKGVAILQYSIPDLLVDRGRREYNEQNSKDDQRQWYARWYDYYMSLDIEEKKNRVKFEKYLEEIINEIVSGDRYLDEDFKNEFLIFAKGYSAEENEFEQFGKIYLSEGFRSKKFGPKAIEDALVASYKNPWLFEIGEEFYPKI